MIGEEIAAEPSTNRAMDKKFICGVIEGFYGRPWTTEQRKDLFGKLKKWGMDSYVYAPKDDYKHRAYWRELYTVEEADHLSSLIAAAKEHDVTFYYALSPGLDMTYSNQKEILTLKRKLDQVSQFGCEAFALLFDDIESELSKADKEAFQTFANAQVSVTNEIYTHLGSPKFLFCPTQYCTTRALPTVHDSEYLNTLGSKLHNSIDIMWTGNKVISKNITLDSIQEITEILRRPPVIWDNLHANDYDQKRVFLGPYSGRSPELIPHLRGVMTNPNCEFHANTIAIHTLASWSQCNLDSKVNSSVSADIKLETENEDGSSAEDLPVDFCLSKNIYHPRVALKNAISVWLEEFFVEKDAWGPITKPQPQVTMVMPIIPILPSINTCMTLTTTTTTSTTAKTIAVPEVNTTQLQALADVCSTVDSSAINPVSNPIMNSLVSPTKVVTNDDIINPIPSNIASNIELPKKIPISIMSVPIMDSQAVTVTTDSCTNELRTSVSISKSLDNADDEQMSPANKIDNLPHSDKDIDLDGGYNVGKAIVEESKNLESETNNIENAIDEEVAIPHDDVQDVAIEEPSTDGDNRTLAIDTAAMLDDNLSPLSAGGNEPMECSSSLTSQTSPKDRDRKAISEDVVMQETASINELNNIMQVESSESSPLSNAEMKEPDEEEAKTTIAERSISVNDLYLLCDLFYLPFEHGSRGLKLLIEFNWLKANANVLLSSGCCGTAVAVDVHKQPLKPEVAEWYERANTFSTLCAAVQDLLKKVANCPNKEICHDLFSYVWDISGALTLLNAFIKWLALGHFPHNVYTYTQGSYTWFSKGWKDAFMSGDQEPWVFRGGLIADLQRLMPVDSGNDLFLYKLPELPTCDYYQLRPYTLLDEPAVNSICTRVHLSDVKFADDEQSGKIELPVALQDLIADSILGPFITLSPELCNVAYDMSNQIVGYAAAAMDVNVFVRNMEVCWIPAMREKYAQSLLDNVADQMPPSKALHEILAGMIAEFHNYDYHCPAEVNNSYPAVITAAVLDDPLAPGYDWKTYIGKRLLTVTLAALRANGCFGVHVRLAANGVDHLQYYSKLGFAEIYRDPVTKHVYVGRRF